MRAATPLCWSAPLFLALILAGCLPSSCNRTESRALLPADSVSRALASTLPVDTLEIRDVITKSDELEMGYPRTVAFAPDGRLWMSDAELHLITAFDESNEVVEQIDAAEFEFPYIAGFKGDTLMVFSPQTRTVESFLGSVRVGSLSMPNDLPERGAFQYVAASEGRLYYKTIAEEFQGYLVRLGSGGQIEERWNLDGPYWRFAGNLRIWGDSLLSLSGYRPVVHIQIGDAAIDTMALSGFDSPMLARSGRFVTGDLAVPPLLSASAAPSGNYLFVLNMRPGWLRVDVYDHGGRLKTVLTQPAPAFNQDYYPTDIAVRRGEDGAYELAVTVIEPEPRIERFIWHEH